MAMIAHLDLDSFFVAVERVRNPDLSGRPVVIGGRPGGNGLVAAASREARRAGIRPGTSLVQAAVLCPGAVFLDGSFDTYLAASLQVDEVLRRVSSEIEWTSIDEAFVGLSRIRVRLDRRCRVSTRCSTSCGGSASTQRSALATRRRWLASPRVWPARAVWSTSSTDTRRDSSPRSRSRCCPISTCPSPVGFARGGIDGWDSWRV